MNANGTKIVAANLISDKDNGIGPVAVRLAFNRHCKDKGIVPTKRQASRFLRENAEWVARFETATTA